MFKTRNQLIVILCTIALAGTINNANSMNFTTIAEPSCQKWINDRKTNNDKDVLLWLRGYISGISAVLSVKSNIDLLKDEDIETLFGWTDEYCRTHTDERIAAAAEIYIMEILKQKSSKQQ